jgi:hypothetical protein
MTIKNLNNQRGGKIRDVCRLTTFCWLLLGLAAQSALADQEYDNSKIINDYEMSDNAKSLWELVHSCTHRLTITGLDSFDIGIGVVLEGKRITVKEFKWEELENFYRKQPDKSIVAIIVDPFQESTSHSEAIAEKFLALGYARIVVAGNTGGGYFLLHDKVPKQESTK